MRAVAFENATDPFGRSAGFFAHTRRVGALGGTIRSE
jgi:hypothetical protein